MSLYLIIQSFHTVEFKCFHFSTLANGPYSIHIEIERHFHKMNTSSCPSKQMSALYYQSHFVWKTCSQFPFLRASMPAWRQCLLFRFYIIRRKNMTCRSSSRKKLSIWKLLLLEVIGIDTFHVAILPHK